MVVKCPFHEEALQDHFPPARVSATDVSKNEAFRNLMTETSAHWPRALDEGFSIHKVGCLGLLSDWCSRATIAAKAMSIGEIWRAGAERCSDFSVGDAIGLLRTLAPMPKQIKTLFVDVGQTWSLDLRHYPAASRQALVSIGAQLFVQAMLDYYKHFTGRTRASTPFMVRANCWKEAFAQDHGECHCRWGRTGSGWNQTWLPVHEDEWPQWSLLCPYQIAIEELDRCSGNKNVDLARSHRNKAEMDYIAASTYMYELGMVKWPEDAAIPSDEIKFFPQNLVHLVWQGTPALNNLLDDLAEREIEQLGSTLTIWLDAIDLGSHPGGRRQIAKSVRLRELEDGLSIVTWTRRDSNVVGSMRSSPTQ